jgi:hypothetical protein
LIVQRKNKKGKEKSGWGVRRGKRLAEMFILFERGTRLGARNSRFDGWEADWLKSRTAAALPWMYWV